MNIGCSFVRDWFVFFFNLLNVLHIACLYITRDHAYTRGQKMRLTSWRRHNESVHHLAVGIQRLTSNGGITIWIILGFLFESFFVLICDGQIIPKIPQYETCINNKISIKLGSKLGVRNCVWHRCLTMKKLWLGIVQSESEYHFVNLSSVISTLTNFRSSKWGRKINCNYI
jgi:hypothetical protein